MITSFSDTRTERLFNGERVRDFPSDLLREAWRKLDMLSNAHTLEDLRVPPGNRLEALGGEHKGLHSIRINDEWRIVFRWRDGHADAVRVMDYH